jgi:hypothetical protein
MTESAEKLAAFDEIPCTSEEGIFGEETGKTIFRTGNFYLIPKNTLPPTGFTPMVAVATRAYITH